MEKVNVKQNLSLEVKSVFEAENYIDVDLVNKTKSPLSKLIWRTEVSCGSSYLRVAKSIPVAIYSKKACRFKPQYKVLIIKHYLQDMNKLFAPTDIMLLPSSSSMFDFLLI